MHRLLTAILLLTLVAASAGTADSLIMKLRGAAEDTNKVNLLSKIGRELLYADARKALAYADSAEKLAEKINYRRGLCRAYMIKGIYYRNAGIYDKGFTYQIDAIRIAETLNDKKIIASAYTNLGILFKNQGNYKKAITYQLEALARTRELGDTIAMANCYQNLSNSSRRDKQSDMAIRSSWDAYRLFDAKKNERGLISAYSSLGAVYMEDRKEYAKALEYFKKAEEIAVRIKEGNSKAVAFQNLATCYGFMKNYKLSEEYARKSLEEGKLQNNPEKDADDYRVLSIALEGQGLTAQALQYYKKYAELNDSITKSRMKQSTLELEERFHAEKSQKEIELLSKLNEAKTRENETQKDQLNRNRIVLAGALLIALVIGVLAFLFYKNFKKTEKLNALLSTKNHQIEYQKKEILDSILYARRIQDSILPQAEELKQALPNHFVTYKPRDIVSGDFYWTFRSGQKSILALCDCTGHGVPGAFMSLISYTLLNHIVKNPSVDSPEKVLNLLSKELPLALRSSTSSGGLRDGLDIALAEIDFSTLQLRCAMAHIPVYVCDGQELKFLAPDKRTISADNSNLASSFSLKTAQLKKGDRIYLCTDGFADQFGGPKGKKLKYKELERLLFETHKLSLEDQKLHVERFFGEWKSNLEQVDDVTLVAIEV